MPFKFQMDRIHELRQKIQKDKEILLESERGKLSELQSLIEVQRQLYFSDREHINALMTKGKLSEIPLYEQNLERHKSRIWNLLEAIQEQRQHVKQAEFEVMKARKEFKIIDNLKEKRKSEWEHAEAQKEQKLLNEQALFQHLRQEGET